jgi:Cd2+/Zn2+-exporting ATPase
VTDRTPGTSPRSFSFRIEGLDCAEEVAVLKRELGGLVGGETNLAFDLLSGRMTVLAPPTGLTGEALAQAVRRTGMTARPWEPRPAKPWDEAWRQRVRATLCAASGLLVAAGFAAHGAAAGGIAPALGAGADGAAGVPLAARLLYLGSIAAGAWFVLPRALASARRLAPDMNLLMTVAVAGAVGLGEWLEAASVAFLFSLALLLEGWSVGRARRAIEALLDLSPPTARVVDPDSGEVAERPVAEVAVGARVRVRPGERLPLDGVVRAGRTAIDQSALTGESIPVAKGPGDEVFAGTVNGDGALEVEVRRPAGDTTLARVIRLVGEARSRRAPAERWVERFARVYTPAMMGLAVAVAVLPPLLGGSWARWFYQALVLLVIACPCALVISTPVSIVAGLAAAARSGVLIKGGGFLEAPARARVVAFDKTGTLTHGRPEVQRVIPLNGHSEQELLARAAALEAEGHHPLARAVVAAARARGVAFRPAAGLTSLPGRGARGEIDGRRFWIGSHRLMEEVGAEHEEHHRLAVELEDAGHSLVAVGNDAHVCGLLAVADAPRAEASEVVAELRAVGVGRVVVLTGDNERTARAVGEAVGADEVRSELLPEDKLGAVEELARRWGPVAMVGDGVNDAPALAAASVGIAMGAAGSDAAIETADVALMSDDLGRLPWLLRHSRRTLAVLRANVAFALATKLAFVVLAAFGAATLWLAIAADMGASLLVIGNSLRLLRGSTG